MSEALGPRATQPDVIIVGGGMAGLSAAMALRPRSVLVLEADTRPGGRLLSQPAGDYWLNMGAHMFGAPETPVGRLLDELRIEAPPIAGRLMGMSYRGRRLIDTPAEAFPFVLPLSLSERLSFVRMGLKLRLGSERLSLELRPRPNETAAGRRARLLAFENTRTLADYIGPLGPDSAAILAAITERNGAHPEEMAAGHGLRSFGNVWTRHAPGRNVTGGSARLPQAMAHALGSSLRLGCEVLSVRQEAAGVSVTFAEQGRTTTVLAKAAIVATPAFVSRRIIAGLPETVATALDTIRYGAFVTAGVLTSETGHMPWDRTYAMATPGRRFSVMFNMATTLRRGARRPGGSLMLFAGARGAVPLLALSDGQIAELFAADLIAEFPEMRGRIQHIVVQKWSAGAPFSAPGRALVQTALAAPIGRIVLAGDYLEFPNIEAAVSTGQEAAATIAAMLGKMGSAGGT